MLILLIETATAVCSVALANDNKILAEVHSEEPNAHSSKLSPFIEQIFAQCGKKVSQLDAVCVSSGPGSYTGLRIGVSTAKGLCYALGKPLLAVPTLQGMAAQYYAPTFNAEELKAVSADIIEPGIYDSYLDRGEVVFVGDGAAKTRDILGCHPNARYAGDFSISATGMLTVALEKLKKGQVEDVAYFEPYYLKDFVAKKSVVRGLH